MRVLKRVLALAGLWFAAQTAQAQPIAPDFGVADTYFSEYLEGNIAALAPLMAEGIEFQDTASHLQGMQATLDGLTTVFRSVSVLDFAERTRFHSGDIAIYDGTLSFTYEGEALGVPGAVFRFDTAFIVALTMNGALVTRHIDYIDLDAFMRQMREQTKAVR